MIAEIMLGCWLVVLALLPGGRFFEGGPTPGKWRLPIEPPWIGRLVIGGIGLGVLLDGLWELFKH